MEWDKEVKKMEGDKENKNRMMIGSKMEEVSTA
jgi:hypothetical protein